VQYLQAYMKRTQMTYNATVNPRSFDKGDLVLYENQKMMSTEVAENGKFSPNWLGPYIVAKSYESRPLMLHICIVIMSNPPWIVWMRK
jgi:hypothetical protein